MTATPIPRTLALTVYGDLQVSEITAPPADRKPIVTAWVSDDRSSEAYERLTHHLRDGRQAYVVCPLIEASETTVARAAEDEAERLRRAELKGFRVGCMHGRLKPAERRAVMQAFTAGEIDVLVATTVIEVGVDVPNATIMIVQEADRFGLAQLHQLRGRVGRGAEQSYCLLVSGPKEELTDVARERLEAMVATTDGFELAERDLEIRGEGQLLGARQSGLSDLRFTRLRQDTDLLERARGAAVRARRRGSPRRRGRAPARRRAPGRLVKEPVVRIIAGERRGATDRRPEGARDAPDRRPRPRGGLQPDRPRRRRRACSTSSPARARWGSRRSRAGARRCVFVESDRDACAVIQPQPREAPLHGRARPLHGRLPGPARGAGGGHASTTSSSSTRPTRRGPSSSRASRRRCPRSSRRTGSSSSRRRRASSRRFRSVSVTSRRYGSARITLFTR